MSPKRFRHHVRVTAVVALAVALGGCGARKSVVTGRVTYKDKPVSNGTVTLFCQDGQIVSGLLTPQGTYTIPNVPFGHAKVAIVTHAPVPPAFQIELTLPPSKDAPARPKAPGPQSKRAIVRGLRAPERYGDPDRSGWSLDVMSASHTLDLRLRP